MKLDRAKQVEDAKSSALPGLSKIYHRKFYYGSEELPSSQERVSDGVDNVDEIIARRASMSYFRFTEMHLHPLSNRGKAKVVRAETFNNILTQQRNAPEASNDAQQRDRQDGGDHDAEEGNENEETQHSMTTDNISQNSHHHNNNSSNSSYARIARFSWPSYEP